MANFLLWNVKRKPLDSLVLGLVEAHAIDVVMLVEHATLISQLPRLLTRVGFEQVESQDRFGVFRREGFSLVRLPALVPMSRVDYFRLTAPSGRDGLIALVHGYDRRNYGDATRAAFFARVVDTVRLEESRSGHRRSIVLGDFNANPFDPAVAGAHGLHAIGVRRVRGRTTRRLLEQDVDFFYNPMWRLYGHGRDAASATHHYAGHDAHELMWYMLDQVIVRPDVPDALPENQLRIVTEVNGVLLTGEDGVPSESTASDHLPLVFGWSL